MSKTSSIFQGSVIKSPIITQENFMDLFSTDTLYAIICLCIVGTAAAYLAKKRGRNPYAWFFIGLFFGLLGLCFLFFLSNKKVETPAILQQNVNSSSKNKPYISSSRMTRCEWYILNASDHAEGPYSFSQIQQKIEENILQKNSYLWNEELTDWVKIEDLGELFKPK